jgi:bis(5'-nucleosyl)-tetraphosphatase (symmetrical)
MKRRIFIGDIQGCRDELERLLDKLRFDPARDRLYPTGDLVNRGPDSLGVLRLLRKLDARSVLGNHDVHLLRRAAGLRRPGRRDTLDEVLKARDRKKLLSWLRKQPFVRAYEDVLLTHAGLNPVWADPERQLRGHDPLVFSEEVDFATRVRYCSADGRRPVKDDPPPGPPFRPWYEHWEKRETRTLVFGHWARRGLIRRARVRGLDTGCVWGGRLTAWVAEDDRIVSVPAARTYCSTSGE